MGQMSGRSRQFQIVLNTERQYSIWPVDQPLPDGWEPAGRSGTKAECLAFIDAAWNEVNPLSQRGGHAGA
jgi:MbtH protein